MKVRRMLCPLLLAAAAACGSGGPASDGDAAGIATVIDSTGDSVVARVAGEVPADALRHLSEELRIAPGVDDTTLFTDVLDFEVDRAGRLWVYDRPSNSIFLFGANGRFIRRFGRQGEGPGEFKWNSGMIARGDSGIAIWDSQNARISFFDSTGTFLTSWLTPAGFSTNDGLVTDRSGALFLKRPVTAPREGEMFGRLGLVILKERGAFGDSLAPPDLAIPREGYTARNKGSVSAYPVPFAPGYHWGWHPNGHFVVAHGGKYEIILSLGNGKPVVIKRQAAAASVNPEESAEERASILYQMRQNQPDWNWSGPPIPATKSPMDQLLLPRDGRIWARVPVASERIPDAELPPSRDPNRPVKHFRTPVVYEIFESDGRFLGRVEFPRRTRFIEADGDLVWALVRIEDDLPAVVRFRITPGLQ
jgi:hypothetical protein